MIESKNLLKQESINKLKKRNADRKSIFMDSEKVGVNKMSEIILDYAEELLELTSTLAEMQKTILISYFCLEYISY